MKLNNIPKLVIPGLVAALLSIQTVQSQDFDFSPDSDYKRYLDDERKSMADNAVKLNTFGFLTGFVSLGYERKLLDKLSVEVMGEVAFLPKYSVFTADQMGVGPMAEETGNETTGAFGFQIMPKYFPTAGAIDYGRSWGPMFRYRKFKTEDKSEFSVKEFGLFLSGQYLYGKRLLISTDIYYNIQFWDIKAYRFNYDKTPYVKELVETNAVGQNAGLQLKLGYAF